MELPAGKYFMAFQSYVKKIYRKSWSCYYGAGAEKIIAIPLKSFTNYFERYHFFQ